MEGVGLPENGGVGWRECPESALLPLSKPGRSRSERLVRSRAPRSSRSGRAPPVRRSPGSRAHRDPGPRRAPLTQPRPPAAACGGRGAGREARGAVRRRLPSVPGEGRSGRAGERESPTDRLPKRAACNRWEAGPAGEEARAVPRRLPDGERGRPGGGGSELAGGGLSPAPACPARSEDAGGRCPGPGTRSVTRRCSCWPSCVPVGPWSTTAARISSTTCGTAPDPGSATQVSAAAAAGRYRRALGWELGPHRGLRQKSDADWGEEGGGCRARGGDQEAARSGLMLDPGGDPGGGRIRGVGAGAGLEGPRPPPALRSPGLRGRGSRAPGSELHFPVSALRARGGRGGKGDEAGGNSRKLGVGDGPGCG